MVVMANYVCMYLLLNTRILFLHRLNPKSQKETTKTKQCNKQICLQIIIPLNITTNNITKKNSKQVNKNKQTTLQE